MTDAGNPIAALQAAIDALLSVELAGLSQDDLVGVTRDLETQVRRLTAVDHRVIAELDGRRVADEFGAPSTAALLRAMLRVSPGEARARVAAAQELGPRRGLTGEALEPIYPSVAAAQVAGTVSTTHARIIAGCLNSLPTVVAANHDREAETTLLECAEQFDPLGLAACARRLKDVLDPDGTLTDDADHQRLRGLTIQRDSDGSGRVSGRLTPFALACCQTILDSLARPHPAEDGEADRRTAEQRRHDALLDAGQPLLRSDELPDCGGVPVSIAVTVPAEQLAGGSGLATTAHGGGLSVAELLREAGEVELVTLGLTRGGGVISYGRDRRTASAGQRRALAARDGGCSFPGCDRPPSWCQAHHVKSWADGGLTSLDNTTLVCGHHHRTFERSGWTCRMVPTASTRPSAPFGSSQDSAGCVPEWIPPRWVDPAQRPRRNPVHNHVARPLVPA